MEETNLVKRIKNKLRGLQHTWITAEMQEENSACHKTSTSTNHWSSTAQSVGFPKQPWEARETYTAILQHHLEHSPKAQKLHELLQYINQNKKRNRKNTK